LPTSTVKNFDKNPHNKNALLSTQQHLWFSGEYISFIIGGNQFRTNLENGSIYRAVTLGDHDVISARRDGSNLLINITISDACNKIVLLIEDNELMFAIDSWDITFVGNTLTIYEKMRLARVKICLRPTDTFVIERSDLYAHGRLCSITPKQFIATDGNSRIELKDCIFNDTGGGVCI
jgi:hypothetical protein